MGRVRRIVGFTSAGLLSVVFLAALCVIGYLVFSERSGQDPRGADKSRLEVSKSYRDGRFHNLVPTAIGGDSVSMFESGLRFLSEGSKRRPDQPLPTMFGCESGWGGSTEETVWVTWFGHSTVLLEVGGRTIVLDPVLGESAAPIAALGRRFETDRPIPDNALPPLDVVIISHDHYDHLDMETIQKLDSVVGRYVVPLGVGSHLEFWGVSADRILELDWWNEVTFDGITITATPARHFSGRMIPESNPTLWASWVMRIGDRRLFFSGDGGYFDVFKEIGSKFGPFDLAIMECGQYNENWAQVHMMPEETVQACLDLGGRLLLPVHWGAFDLSLHEWNEPPIRLRTEAARRGVEVTFPRIGQRFNIESPPAEVWW